MTRIHVSFAKMGLDLRFLADFEKQEGRHSRFPIFILNFLRTLTIAVLIQEKLDAKKEVAGNMVFVVCVCVCMCVSECTGSVG